MGKIIPITSRLQRLIDVAINSARSSNMNQQHGAVIFRGNTVYSSGCNTDDKVFNGYTGLPSCHAEMNCLRFVTKRRHRFEDSL
jgi:deoxycytidylate deaminase